jgi:Ca2+-binding RTX toxin-like protein
LAEGDWSDIPRVELLSGSGMGGAVGAWASSTQTIYLNSDWLSGASKEQINAVLTEEFGHYLDSQLNKTDTEGDEGELFSRILGGEALSSDAVVQALRSENDEAALTLENGRQIHAETANLTGGEGNDTLTGTNSADTINGRGGDDTIDGAGGNDAINGGDGIDTINGGEGDDIIDGGRAADYLYGNGGNDTFSLRNSYRDEPDSVISGGGGNDFADLVYYGFFAVDLGEGEDIAAISLYIAREWSLEVRTIDGGDGYDQVRFSEFSDGKLSNETFRDFGLYFILKGVESIWADTAVPPMVLTNNAIRELDSDRLSLVGDNFSGIDAEQFDSPIHLTGSSGIVKGSRYQDVFDSSTSGVRPSSFRGNAGNDYYHGGDGIDVAEFSGNSSDYTITEITYNTFEVTDNRAGSPDGTDTIIDVNKLRFADGEQDVVIAGLNIVGDDSAEEIDGGSSADYIDGAGGNDTVNGGGGNDDLQGGNDNDTVTGGEGGDFIDGDAGDDNLSGNQGNDDINGGDGIDTVNYAGTTVGVSINLTTGTASSSTTGTDTLEEIENVVTGSGTDNITGNSEDNTLNGGGGRDTMAGGLGNDIYVVDIATDVVTEDSGVTNGVDLVQASVSYTITDADIENLTLTESAAVNATGNASANTLTGNTGNNTLDGGGGTDTMAGGAGNDTYKVDVVGDVITEAASAGTDTVETASTYTLGANLENLTLTGTAAINGTGNNAVNTLTGNSGNNILDGGAGVDTMVGGAGNDSLIGGVGNDSLNGGNGTDTADYSAATGAVNVNLTSGTASGSLGTDTLTAIENATGGAAADSLTGNSGNNSLSSGGSNDSLNGGSGNDSLVGGVGNDALIGGIGNDSLNGGDGVDTANYASVTSALTINLSAGTATGDGSDVLTAIESVITGSAADALTGDGNANMLDSGSGNDIINGGAGNDSIIGGIGNDALNGGAGNDSLNGGDGIDIADYSAATGAVTINLTAGTATGSLGADTLSAIENATGGSAADSLTGNTANNTFSGGAANDSLNGGLGADALTGQAGADRFAYTALNASLLSGVDHITDLVIGTDAIDGTVAVTAVNLRELGTVSALTQAGVGAVLTTSAFVANGAATFAFGIGAGVRTFLALNDGTAGFSGTTDAVIEITGFTGSLTSLAVV